MSKDVYSTEIRDRNRRQKSRLFSVLLVMCALFMLPEVKGREYTFTSPADPIPADSLFRKGLTLIGQKEYRRAVLAFSRAGDKYLSGGDTVNYFTTLVRATSACYEGHMYLKGDSLLRSSIQVFHQMGRPVADTVRIRFLNNRAVSFLLTGQSDSARMVYQEVVKLGEHAGVVNNDLSIAFNNLGFLFNRAGDPRQAASYFKRAVHIREHILNPGDVRLAVLYSNYAAVLSGLARYDEAEDYLIRAEKVYFTQNNPDDPALGRVYNNLGINYFAEGDYLKAHDYFSRALQLFGAAPGRYLSDISNIYNNLGLIASKKGSYEEALNWFFKNIQNNRRDHPEELGRTYLKVADVYRKKKQYGLYDNYLIRAIDNINKYYISTHPLKAIAYLGLGWSALNEGAYARSLGNYREALNLYVYNFGFKSPGTAICLQNIARVYQETGRSDSALFYVQRSLMANVPGFDRENIAFNPEPARAFSRLRLLFSLNLKAQLLKERYTGNPVDTLSLRLSLAALDTAVKTIELLRLEYNSEESRLYLARNESGTYLEGINTALLLYEKTGENRCLDKAFEFTEKGKSAVLLSMLHGVKAIKQGDINPALVIMEDRLKKELGSYKETLYLEREKQQTDSSRMAFYEKQIFELSRKHDSLLQVFETRYPKFYSLKYNTLVVTPSRLASMLKKNQVVIEYTVTDSMLITFFISRDLFFVKKQSVSPLFFSHIRTLIQRLTDNDFSKNRGINYASFNYVSSSLYAELVKPFEKYIKDKELLIIPDRELAYIPFGALLTQLPHTGDVEYQSLPYLIRKNPIGYAYSGTLLAEHLSASGKGHKLLAFAPTYPADSVPMDTLAFRQGSRNKLSPLPFSQEEVSSIGKILPGKIVIGETASETNFKKLAPDYGILHLAMHTLIDDRNPLYSNLAFSFVPGDTLNDGFLTLSEIYNLQLSGKLTVLSACSSGSGNLSKGEGVMSLARGFMYAGCPAIVMTLWEVDDKLGAGLMERFYQYLKKGYSKNKALQKAKLDFLDTHGSLRTNPYFWAAYVDIGNPRPVFTLPYRGWLLAGSLVFAGLFFGFLIGRRKHKRDRLGGVRRSGNAK